MTPLPDPQAGPILVSHVGRRDSYELAYALSLSGRPVHLVTDFYYQPGTLVGRLARAVFGSGVHKRHRPDLRVTVHSSPLLFALDLMERVLPRNKAVNRLRGVALGCRCLRVIRRHGVTDAYLYTNSGAGRLSRAGVPARVTLFQMHPHAEALVRLYRRYMAARPALAGTLASQEEELTESRAYFDLLAGEARLAHRVLCTSGFVRQTLLDAGLPPDRIAVVPYGTRPQDPEPDAHPAPDTSRPAIRLAFVGQFVVRKGVHELLRLAQARPEVAVAVFTRESEAARALTLDWLGAVPANVTFRRLLDDRELWQEARACDFLVLPSLAEGYGLVLAEALGQGLPVIATRASAAPDLIADGVGGFLLDDASATDLARAVDRAMGRRTDWPRMREAARAAAALHTWDRFRQGIIDLLPASAQPADDAAPSPRPATAASRAAPLWPRLSGHP